MAESLDIDQLSDLPVELKEKLKSSNQQHLLRFWDELLPEDRKSFVEHLGSIDWERVTSVAKLAKQSMQPEGQKPDDHMEPYVPQRVEDMSARTVENYSEIAYEEIACGRVAVLLLAGGQGTRLGVSYPKGMFPLELPSGKTLLQLQAERIRKVCDLAEFEYGEPGKICWYIMTSPATHEATEDYLKKHEYFGLSKEDVVLFQQGMFPCFDFNGKMLLEDKKTVVMAPDGNGGVYSALRKNNILVDMKQRGITYVHVHSVDNILVKVADPVFLGYCIDKKADCGVKVIPKTDPLEPLGVICQVDDRIQVVEYSELTEKNANLRYFFDGKLVFSAGNICNHVFETRFLERMARLDDLEFQMHVAKKKIPHTDESGRRVLPTSPNGIKLEKFIFDVFRYSENFCCLEMPRNTEFSPLKNCDGSSVDCPSTCRRDLLDLHRLYVKNAGGTVKDCDVEISPLLSYAGENLAEKVEGKVFDCDTILRADDEEQ